jgi:hypothetical protein
VNVEPIQPLFDVLKVHIESDVHAAVVALQKHRKDYLLHPPLVWTDGGDLHREASFGEARFEHQHSCEP